MYHVMCVCVCVCVCVCACSAFVCLCLFVCLFQFPNDILCKYVNCFGRTVLYMCIEYHIQVNMYHVSAQGVDERTMHVHYYY